MAAMKTLLTQEQLRQGIERMAEEIRKHYAGRPLAVVGVLMGSVVAALEPHEMAEE